MDLRSSSSPSFRRLARRIAELEAELAATRRANELLKVVVPPKGRFRAIAQMAEEGHRVQVACRVLAVSESGFYAFRSRSPSARAIRHAWLTDVITRVHLESRGTYGGGVLVGAFGSLLLGQNFTLESGAIVTFSGCS